MKELLKNIWYNFKVPLILGVLGVLILTFYVNDFDSSNIHWYYIGIILCSGGGVACIIYIILKMLDK